MQRFRYLLFFLFLSIQIVLGQNVLLDSLENELKNARIDTQRIDLMNQIAAGFIVIDLEKTKKYAEKALSEAEKIGYEKGIMNACNYLDMYYQSIQNIEKRIFYSHKNLDFAEKSKHIEKIQNARNNLANLYMDIANYQKAKELFFLNIKQSNPNSLTKAQAYQNLADVYFRIAKYDSTITTLRLALDIYTMHHDNKGIGDIEDKIGQFYREMGLYESSFEHYEKALKVRQKYDTTFALETEYGLALSRFYKDKDAQKTRQDLEKSLGKFEKRQDSTGVAICLFGIGKTYFFEHNYTEALRFFEKSLRFEKGERIFFRIDLFHFLGKIYHTQKNYTKALSFYEKALKMAQEYDFKNLTLEIHESFSNFYKEQKLIEKALFHLQEYKDLRDDIFSITSSIKTAEFSQQYENEKLKTQNAEKEAALEKEKAISKRNNFIFGFSLVLVLVAVFGYFYRKRQHEKLRYQKRLLSEKQREIQIQEELNTHIASELHDGPKSKIKLAMRQAQGEVYALLEDVLYDLTFISERTAHKQHLSLPRQISSFLDRVIPKDDLDYDFRKPADDSIWLRLHPTVSLHLFRIVTEAVSNVIKYAESPFVNISLEIENDQIILIIEDGGKGLPSNYELTVEGMGLQNIKHRVDVLDGKLSIHSIPEEGTTIEVRVTFKSLS